MNLWPARRQVFLSIIVIVVSACASAGRFRSVQRAGTQVAELRSAIDSMADAPEFHNAFWGVLVVDPERGDTLYSRNAGKLFLPASNMKIITSSVALEQLGPDFTYRTTLIGRGPIQGGTLTGDLAVIGRGDPTISDHMWVDAMIPLRALADSLAARGIRRVAGRIVANGNAFPGPRRRFGYAWGALEPPDSARRDRLRCDG